jgi:hypothetical protein
VVVLVVQLLRRAARRGHAVADQVGRPGLLLPEHRGPLLLQLRRQSPGLRPRLFRRLAGGALHAIGGLAGGLARGVLQLAGLAADLLGPLLGQPLGVVGLARAGQRRRGGRRRRPDDRRLRPAGPRRLARRRRARRPRGPVARWGRRVPFIHGDLLLRPITPGPF